jgi:hypothetical protein
MREVVELQASAVVSATKENVAKKSEDKLQLDINISSPVIVIPASSTSSDHVSFKLGMH